MDLKFLVVPIVLLMNACANLTDNNLLPIQSEPIINQKEPLPELLAATFFGDKKPVLTVDQIYLLTEQQKQDFLTEFNSPQYQSTEPHKRIYRYLENHLSDFNYYPDTLTASEALIQNQGNCLSLAILTKTLADIVKVDSAYQLVETAPVFKKSGNIIVTSQHIRTVLFAPKKIAPTGLILVRGIIYIDYFPTFQSRVIRNVDLAEFESMYYTNKAAESLMQKDHNQAYWYLTESLSLKPSHSHAINMMALLHEYVGYPDYAEKLFLFGIKHSADPLDMLSNYHSLLTSQQRHQEAQEIAAKIGRRNDTNPYKWISIANSAYNSEEYAKAIRFYQKANVLAPYLHEPHAGIARSKYRQGYPNRAKKEMVNALDKVHDKNIRKLYQAKLDMLSELLRKNTPVVIKTQ